MSELSLVLGILVLFWAGAPIVIFGVYGAIILYYNKRGSASYQNPDRLKAGKEYEPTVSIVVPTHNEAPTISKRIDNFLELTYPKGKTRNAFRG